MATDTTPIICTCACGCRNDCAPFKIPLCYDCAMSGSCEQLSKEKGYRDGTEEIMPDPFSVTYKDGALIVDGKYDSNKFYRLAVISPNGNPIQDVNPEWAGWPFVWSAANFPGNPPPAPPLTWTLQEENYISRRWRNRSQYPADYVSTTYEGKID